MFRRSGSAVTWFVAGDLPDPRGPAFVEALRNQRFRSIENAASEESSVGWVSPGDPTGSSFELDDLDLDAAIWLRMRFDRKKLPPIWVTIHRTEAERTAGRKLNAAERRELKLGLFGSLLPRVLPSVRLVDALYDPSQKRILLFATSTSVREEFNKLFVRTFAVNLVESDPAVLAAHVGLEREPLGYLDQVSPVPWPTRNGTGRPSREVAAPAPAGEVEA